MIKTVSYAKAYQDHAAVAQTTACQGNRQEKEVNKAATL